MKGAESLIPNFGKSHDDFGRLTSPHLTQQRLWRELVLGSWSVFLLDVGGLPPLLHVPLMLRNSPESK